MIKARMVLVTHALVFALALCLTVPVRATIIDTNVYVGMRIEVEEDPFTAEVYDEDTGTTYASVNITLDHPTSLDQITAWSEINIDPLTAEAANVFFDIGWDSLYWPEDTQAGELRAEHPNYASITYDAVVNTTLTYTWDFDYSGYFPFGMNTVKIRSNGTEIFNEGSASGTGAYSGNNTFDMLAGNQYIFEMILEPNISASSIKDLQGNLKGDVSFDFAAVPEPATMLLLGSGLLGLVAFSRRFRKS